jgi:hypothetical protein
MTSDVLMRTTTLPKWLTIHQPSVHLRLIPNHPLVSSQQRSAENSLHRHPQLNNSLPSLNLNLLPRPRRLCNLRLRRSLSLSLSNHTWSLRLVRWRWMRIMMTAVMRRRDRSKLKAKGTAQRRATALVMIEVVCVRAIICWHCKDVGLARFKLLCKKYLSICSNSFVDELMCLPIMVLWNSTRHRAGG